eukprot:SAG31_NODE_969_length_10677_cov_7.080072_2_plen_196_part_00
MAKHTENLMAKAQADGLRLRDLETQLREANMRRQALENRLKSSKEHNTVEKQRAEQRAKELAAASREACDGEAQLRRRLEVAERRAESAEKRAIAAEQELHELEEELAELRRLKKQAWQKNSELLEQMSSIERSRESEWMQKLMDAVKDIKVAVIAPQVTVNIPRRTGGARQTHSIASKPSMPSQQIQAWFVYQN